MKYLSIVKAEEFIANALRANKVPAADALVIAQLMVKSEQII